jgi:hypothetical protein
MNQVIRAEHFRRVDRNQEAITEARIKARVALMELIEVAGDYLHPVYAPKREAYFTLVTAYATLTDQTFDSAIAHLL